MRPIAKIYTDFPEKFGLPRQSGIVKELCGKIIFEPEYRDISAVRGLDKYSHIWLLWQFSGFDGGDWSPTVRPPRLGGNKRMGVFATRSPNRPNPIGLSAVRLEKISFDEKLGAVLEVSGIDMMNGTPIYDIKPYIPHADTVPDANGGFSDRARDYRLDVEISDEIKRDIDEETLSEIKGIIAEDPRPSYQNDETRIYRFTFAGHQISFRVKDRTATVTEILD